MNYAEIHNNLTQINLTKVKRQDNAEFINILSKIRDCQFEDSVYKFISAHTTRKDPTDEQTIIASKNDAIRGYNEI